MRRRTFLTSAAAALWGAGVSAATARTPSPARLPGAPGPHRGERATRAFSFARVNVSRERVIRTTVGLRPHRDSGFVLRADKLDGKLLIHNYGHGGAGMSLAWGTGALAADMALRQGKRKAAVLGCGSPGLTAARQLQRRGFAVTIYTKTVPPDTTSNMSMAAFTPTAGLVERDRRTPAWDEQFRKAAEISYRQLQLLAGRDYGVYWMDSFTCTDDPFAPPNPDAMANAALLPEPLRSGRDRLILGPGEHPFPTRYAIRSPSLSLEPSVYLDKLVEDFIEAGGRIVIRAFDSPRDVADLAEPVIVNCTGLGSLALFNDQELVPIKGQLTALVPQPELSYRVGSRVAGPDGEQVNVSMNPRSDGVIIGNLQERGDWSLEPSPEVIERNLTAAMQFFGAMRDSPQSASPHI